MKTTKVTFNITVEVLHINSVPGLLEEVIRAIMNENEQGMLHKDDGDEVYWSVKRDNVEF